MPFTLSHPALIVPVHRVFKKWTSLTGLIVGSMAPDFEKFLTMRLSNTFSHSLAGVFLFSLPVSLVLCFLYHLVVRDTLLDNLPNFLRKRLYPFKQLHWISFFRNNYLVVISSILVGALLHLFWDAFTHEDGYLEDILFPFQDKRFGVVGLSISLYQLLQLLSSFFGMLVVMYALLKLPAGEAPVKCSGIWPYWLLLLAVTLLLVVVRVLVYEPGRRLEIAFTVVLAFMISLVLTPLIRKPATLLR
ncbi:DUF4184 family protein [Pontibacter sp. 13R65]|uniref:DUF4184 family protein n=1 Tax=Pontibacter sp. 13R65 TaxID=3127458 RepID=UPI00301C420C